MFIHEVWKSLFASFHICLFPCRYLLSLCLCIFPWTCCFTKLLMSFVLCNWRNTLRWKLGVGRIHITLDFILESKYFVGNYYITTYIFCRTLKRLRIGWTQCGSRWWWVEEDLTTDDELTLDLMHFNLLTLGPCFRVGKWASCFRRGG